MEYAMVPGCYQVSKQIQTYLSLLSDIYMEAELLGGRNPSPSDSPSHYSMPEQLVCP